MEPNEAIESLKLKFTSSNPIPVERATILRKEWNAILELLESTRWIPVSERLPEFGVSVLVNGMKRLHFSVAFINKHGEWLIETSSDTINIYPPTHWMPLPQPPKED